MSEILSWSKAQQKIAQQEEKASALVNPTVVKTTIVGATIEIPTIVKNTTIVEAPPELSQITIVEDSTIAGYTRVPNVILDRILGTLKPFDQVVLLRLYRLSRGFGKGTCRVGYTTLSKACNISLKQAQICIERLIQTGYIERLGVEQGGKNRQLRGSEYKVNLPAISTKENPTIADVTIVENTTNKVKAFKENLKRDARACPDCGGSGWFYPKGIDKGVSKCKHAKLKTDS